MKNNQRLTQALASAWTGLKKHSRIVAAAIAVPTIVLSAVALSAPSPPAIAPVALATEPLFAKGAQDRPTITLALSVEFPTVGPQYPAPNASNWDETYSPNTEYIGYFDAESCYSYVDDASPALRRFDRNGPAINHGCGGRGFSGNFMNWASSSAIDLLRMGLTGGDRVIDTPDLTVVQRAMLPANFWHTTHAPIKKLKASLVGQAVPDALHPGYNGEIFVSNCYNRIFFGTGWENSFCSVSSTSGNLGTAVSLGEDAGPPTSYSNLPADFTGPCAGESQTCQFAGWREVAYGADTRWTAGYFLNNAACTNGQFGDPAPGTVKKCYSRPAPDGYDGSGAARGPVTAYNGPLPSGFVFCAGESKTNRCSFSGVKQVAYGIGDKWFFMSAKDSALCYYSVFGLFPGWGNKQCYVRDDPTGWQPPGTAPKTALSSDAFFYSRVRMCESNGSGVLTDPRTSRCQQYPSGNFKPVGTLQRYSDRVRVAAFGYILDNRKERYGGVLRAPMKYVGPTAYDANGNTVAGGNPKKEWDPVTGVFIENPENASPEKISGAINYLNRFGRTGSPGNYKTFDPLAELYYESVRYLQGLPPTPQATQGMTDAMKDGFPVYTTWVDPHEGGSPTRDYSCNRNHIITIGDDNSHEDKSVPGNTQKLWDYEFSRPANLAGNEPDFFQWTHVTGAFEVNAGDTYLDGNGVTQTTSNPGPWINGDRYGQQWYYAPVKGSDVNKTGYFMAGIAYWANTHDIRGSTWSDATKRRPGMRITSHFLDVNEGGEASGLDYRHDMPMWQAAKYGGFDDRSGIGNPHYSASGVPDNSPWEKPEEPGEPKTYHLASSARSVLNALDNMFASVVKQAASIGGSAMSTQTLGTTGGNIYQAWFDPSAWNGDLISYPVTVSNIGTVGIADNASAQWKAATQLDAMDWTKRKIFVGKTVRGTATAATELAWGSIESGSGKLADLLDSPLPGAAADGMAQLRLDFLRGDRSQEGSKLRKRDSRLGDILNSAVAYSGAPSSTIGGADYASFFSANTGRAKAVFAGANDGMLHAFNAADGNELFAYIPSWLGPKLATLSHPNYNYAYHQSYVDASPSVGEAKVGSNWKTVLVGGTGAGGQGVYALDVTNPAAFSANSVMWEFTDKDDADLGNVIGKPQILKLNVSEPGTVPQYKWFAVVASGVNNYVDDGSFSNTGNPAIFLLDLSKPTAAAWSLGTNYYKVSVPADSSLTASKATGIVTFTAEGGPAGEVARIYFGDLHGRLWKLDFTKVGTANWNMNRLSAFSTSYDASGAATGSPLPLYIARDKTPAMAAQPITAAPTLLVGPDKGTIVTFGTGKYLEDADNYVAASTQPQTVYAIFDNGRSVSDGGTSGSVIAGRGRLAPGSVVGLDGLSIPSFKWGRAMTDTDPVRSGWYFDLPSSGEKQVSDIRVVGSEIIFASILPPAVSASSCGGGSGFMYAVNLASGVGTYSRSTIGMLTSPLAPEFGNAAVTTTDSTGARVSTRTRQIISQGTGGLQTADSKSVSYRTGRLSWRQINNYRGLRNK